jgi:enoyl-CoA hydratase/carnithine racemase
VSFVAVERDGAVALVRLERDEKLNAISTAVERELSAALASEEVRTSRAVVISGSGRAFSAGADVTELADRDPEAILRYYRETGGVYEELAALPQPTLAAIHGYCLGGGLELALAADFRIADESAVLGFPEVGIGILPSSGGTARATRLVGAAQAKRLILLGHRLSAGEALAAGLVTEVVADAPARALELARRLAELSPAAVAVAKAAIDAAAQSSHDAALLIERLGYAVLAQIPPPS